MKIQTNECSFNGHSKTIRVSQCHNLSVLDLKEVTTEAISRTKLQSNHHHQQTNSRLFTGRMSFLSPNQQCHSTEGSHTDTNIGLELILLDKRSVSPCEAVVMNVAVHFFHSPLWLFWLSCHYWPSDWLERLLWGSLTMSRGSAQAEESL